MSQDSSCIFCKIASGELPATRIGESAHAVAFMDINPISPGHALVIPRRHCETLAEMSATEAADMFGLAARLAPAVQKALGSEGLNVLQNNGRCAGQVVMHVHVHLIPRWGGDGLKWPWPARKAELADLQAQGEKIRGYLAKP